MRDLEDLRVGDIDVLEAVRWMDPPDLVDEVGHPKHVDPASDHAVVHLDVIAILSVTFTHPYDLTAADVIDDQKRHI